MSGPHVPKRIVPTQAPVFFQLPGAGSRVYNLNGVPPARLGVNGDFALRKDGGGAGATHIYFKNAGAWIGIA